MRSTMVSSAWLLVAVVVMMVAVAEAHNWIGGPSRARQASVTKPCTARVDNQPHVQIGPKQTFQMDWSMGHGDSNTKTYYFVALHADDYDELNSVTPAILDAYIKAAPASAYQYNSTFWKKKHAHRGTTYQMESMYGTQILANDTDYIERDLAYSKAKSFTVPNTSYRQYRFWPNSTDQDVRVSYLHANYSWIEAVHRFKNPFFTHDPYAGQYNFAEFNIPGRKGPGDYIYYFYWGGYRDCVDVNVQPVNMTNRYGIYNASAASSYVKIDHCQFYYMTNPATQCTVVDRVTSSAQACLSACTKLNADTCNGVQATLVTNPANTLTYTPGIPWLWHNATALLNSGTPLMLESPCGSPDLHLRQTLGCPLVSPMCNYTKVAPRSSDYICYGLNPFRDQNLQTIEDYIIVDDAADPRFYSTCWIKVAVRGFLNIPSLPTPAAVWDVGDSCLDCSFASAAQSLPLATVPKWASGLTSTCVNCASPTI